MIAGYRTVLYACDRRLGTARRIGSDDIFSDVPDVVQLRHGVVFIAAASCDKEVPAPCSYKFIDIDLASRTNFARRAFGGYKGARVRTVRLTSRRRYGLALARTSAPRPVVAIFARDRTGVRKVDESANIDAASLKIDGSELQWRNAGVLRHAALRS